MKTSLIKMLRDLKLYQGRTILTLIGVLIGVAAVGAVLSAYAILNREMNRNFMDTNPASIVFNVINLDDKAVGLIKESYRNTDVDIRKTILARVAKGDGTFGTIYLRAIEDFKKQQVDTFSLEKGHFPVNASEMVLERDCLKILKNIKEGVDDSESLLIKLPGKNAKPMPLSGVVHAPGLAPASMEHYSYGFVTLVGLRSLGYQGWYDEVRIVCHDNRFDREVMKKVAQNIKKTLLENGYLVKRVDVLKPGKHPHASQLSSILFLLQAFTVISLLVACIIIINLLNFIMAKQSKQIAVMKAVGAGTGDIVLPYFSYVLIISLGGLILSFPLSITAGRGYSDFAAYILNFKISSYAVPFWVFSVQSLVSILIPLASAAYPIFKSCTINVKDGLCEKVSSPQETNSRNAFVTGVFFRLNSRIIMPINNLTRKKFRTFLAILALTAGGVLFMTSQNIVASIDKTVDASFKVFRWDLDIRLAQNYPEDQLKGVLKSIAGLDKIEICESNNVLLKKPDGTDSANYAIKIIPEKSRMVKLTIADNPKINNIGNAIVVTKALAADETWLKPGLKTKIAINDITAEVLITGIVSEVPDFSTVYMEHTTYEKLFGGRSNQSILASAATRDISKQREITKAIEERFRSAGIEIAENWNIYILRKAFVDHLRIIVTLLAVLAMLAVVVGGLSIASAIGINVSERKREIGVLRAVGINSRQIITMVSMEVFLMGIAGWLLAVILSYPVSVFVGNYFGQIFLNTNLQNTLSPSGAIQWLVISIVVSFISGLLPAWKVATSSLREMLTYE